jgi:hypothetical protein
MSSNGKNHQSISTDATTDLLCDRFEVARKAGIMSELEARQFARILLLGAALTMGSRYLALADELPNVSDRPPVPAAHFPDAAHAIVWRNWQLVEPHRLAAVLGTSAGKVVELARDAGAWLHHARAPKLALAAL